MYVCDNPILCLWVMNWKKIPKKPHDKSNWKMMDNGWQSDGSAILTDVLSFVSSVVLSYDSREQFIFLRQICYEVLHWYVFLKHVCLSSLDKMHVKCLSIKHISSSARRLCPMKLQCVLHCTAQVGCNRSCTPLHFSRVNETQTIGVAVRVS
jgi:hypothetical protein